MQLLINLTPCGFNITARASPQIRCWLFFYFRVRKWKEWHEYLQKWNRDWVFTHKWAPRRLAIYVH